MTPHPLPCLGLDPGLEGGAVLVAPTSGPRGRVLGAWGWRESVGDGEAGFRVLAADGTTGPWLPSLHAVGMVIAKEAALLIPGVAPRPFRLCLEGLFGGGPRGLALAEHAGEIAGPLGGVRAALTESLRGGRQRPNATRWRAKVLRLPATTDADAAEAYAIKAVGCGAVVENPGALGALAASGHVAEAACMAVYGLWVAARETAA